MANPPQKPFLSIGPQRLSPLVLTCEHATNRLPSGTPRDAASRELLDTHWGWDPGAWALTKGLARAFEASAVGGRWSRLLIDLNRQVGDETLIRAEAGDTEVAWNADLTPEEQEKRILELHAPYHAEIDRLLVRRLVRDIQPLLFAVHTFTPDYQGERRDFEAGVLFVDHGPLALRLQEELLRRGHDTRLNEPYSGLEGLMYAAERHGSHHRIACLELEVRQDRLTAEEEVADWVEDLSAALEPLLPGPG